MRIDIDASRPLVLGSQSPRRKELLERIGVPFIVRPADVDETVRVGERPEDYLQRVVLAKMGAVCGLAATSSTILTADTVVVAPDGAILGKPADDREAQSMLRRLAGATHEVATRFALAVGGRPAPGAEASAAQAAFALAHAETVTTRVTFRAVSASEIVDYVATGEGRDKAGSYAVQGLAAAFVARIDGSFTGVVGLPLSELCVALRGLGWRGA